MASEAQFEDDSEELFDYAASYEGIEEGDEGIEVEERSSPLHQHSPKLTNQPNVADVALTSEAGTANQCRAQAKASPLAMFDFGDTEDVAPWAIGGCTTPLRFRSDCGMFEEEEAEEEDRVYHVWLREEEMPDLQEGLEASEECTAFFEGEAASTAAQGVVHYRLQESPYGRLPTLRFFSLYGPPPQDPPVERPAHDPAEAEFANGHDSAAPAASPDADVTPADTPEPSSSSEDPPVSSSASSSNAPAHIVQTVPLADEDSIVYFRIWKTPQRDLLVQTLWRSGLVATRQDRWNVLWGARLKEEQYQTLNPHQKVSHFPGTWHIGRKDHLFRHLQRMKRTHGAAEYPFVPQMYFLPQEIRLLADTLSSGDDLGGARARDRDSASDYVAYIVKPAAGACGKGIYLIDDVQALEGVEEETLAQRYIHNPLLMNGFKFDLRLYVLLTSIDPLRLYLYPEGLVRFATQKYAFDPTTLHNPFVHLTNYSINKRATETEDSDSPGIKWLLSTLVQVLRRAGVKWDPVWLRIKDLVVKTFLAIEPIVCSKVAQLVQYRNSCYELFGLDVLLDDRLRPYLIEVNPMPSLHTATPMDKKLKAELLQNMFQTIGVTRYDRKAHTEQQQNAKRARQMGLRAGAVPGVPTNNCGIAARKRPPIGQLWRPDFLALVGPEERAVLQDYMEERGRARGFDRLYPGPACEAQYGPLFETPRWLNALLCRWEQALAGPHAADFLRWLEDGRGAVPLLRNGAKQPRYAAPATEDPDRVPPPKRPRAHLQPPAKPPGATGERPEPPSGERPTRHRREKEAVMSPASESEPDAAPDPEALPDRCTADAGAGAGPDPDHPPAPDDSPRYHGDTSGEVPSVSFAAAVQRRREGAEFAGAPGPGPEGPPEPEAPAGADAAGVRPDPKFDLRRRWYDVQRRPPSLPCFAGAMPVLPGPVGPKGVLGAAGPLPRLPLALGAPPGAPLPRPARIPPALPAPPHGARKSVTAPAALLQHKPSWPGGKGRLGGRPVEAVPVSVVTLQLSGMGRPV